MSVTYPQGFSACGITAGLKASGKPDLALVVNTGPLAIAGGVFTSNRVFAAPVQVSREHLVDGQARAIVLNSGGANACTGNAGLADARLMAAHTAAALQLPAQQVLVASTGLIGQRLPMDLVTAGIDTAVCNLSSHGGDAAAGAIITTDTVTKTVTLQGAGYRIGAMAKGAGMLAPGMATMLCVVTTDAVVNPQELEQILPVAVEKTLNRVDSDGCMSTNDSVYVLASGASGNAISAEQLAADLERVLGDIARQLVADAEGASHDISISVNNASSEAASVAVARAVSRSNLFKAAIFGQDPNWGRIVSAVGTVPETVAPFDAFALDVKVNGVEVCKSTAVGQDRTLVQMDQRLVQVEIDLHAGDAHATIWTNDLTHDYVHENSAYST